MPIKLFKVSGIGFENWCFAPDSTSAKSIVLKDLFNGLSKNFTLKDVTEQYMQEDGVKLLIDSGFVGIPKVAVFFLNGSISHSNDHYKTKNRSSTLFYSEKVPGSRELWR